MVPTQSFSQKRVLITGANGFIGMCLADRLAGEQAMVHAVASPQSSCENLKRLQHLVSIHRADLRNFNEIKKVIDEVKPQILYHLASYGNHPQHYSGSSEEDLRRIVEINMMGTANLLAACYDLDFECLVNTGSAFGEYGPGAKPMNEMQRLAPCTYYGSSKAGATLLCSAFGEIQKKKVATLRPLYVYGPGDWAFRFIPVVISKCLNGEELSLTSLKEKKSFVFIDDVLEAYRLVYLKNFEGAPVMNIGAAKETALEEIIHLVEGCLGKKVRYTEGAYKKLQWPSVSWSSDITLAKKILGWEPKTDLKTGIQQTVDWMMSRQKN